MPFPCATCDREISLRAATCPGCGEPEAGRKAYEFQNLMLGRTPPSTRPVQPDAALAQIVGSAPLLRADLTKKLWDYIKAHGLQDPRKKTMIHADEKLLPVFGGRTTVSMFEMTKCVTAHTR